MTAALRWRGKKEDEVFRKDFYAAANGQLSHGNRRVNKLRNQRDAPGKKLYASHTGRREKTLFVHKSRAQKERNQFGDEFDRFCENLDGKDDEMLRSSPGGKLCWKRGKGKKKKPRKRPSASILKYAQNDIGEVRKTGDVGISFTRALH